MDPPRQLHVTQPAVTQQIQSLEKELNVKLFIRTTRTVRLTEEGKVFLNDARQLVAISNRAKKRFENTNGSEIQILSVGCYNFPMLFLLTDPLRQLSKSYPDLHPRLQVIPFQHIFRLLDDEDLDMIIGFKEPRSNHIKAHYQELIQVPLTFVCPENHPLAPKKRISLDEIQQEKLVLIAPQHNNTALAQIQAQLMGGRAPSEFYFCDSDEAIAVLVRAGFGIAILPDLFVPEDDRLVKIPVDSLAPISFGIYYKSLQGNRLLRPFIEILKTFFAQIY